MRQMKPNPRLPKDRQELILRHIEYKQVVRRCLCPARIKQSYERSMNKSELMILLINICEDDEIEPAPKLRFKKGHRTFYRSRDKSINIANHPHSMNAHALIHELAHHVCNPPIAKLRYDAALKGLPKISYHGRMFTTYMEYLLKEYEKYWMAAPA